jgi:hypothetical protein
VSDGDSWGLEARGTSLELGVVWSHSDFPKRLASPYFLFRYSTTSTKRKLLMHGWVKTAWQRIQLLAKAFNKVKQQSACSGAIPKRYSLLRSSSF